MNADVIVAGAGPAGVATAVALARRRPDLADGGRIVCFDKARFPREKPCGGGLTGHARTALDSLGLSVRVPAVPCRLGRIVYGAEARTVTLDRPVDVIRREEFDADLVAQAREQGVIVVEGEAVLSHEVDLGRGVVSVTTSEGRRAQARVLVGADGAGSRVRKVLLGNDARPSARPLRLFKLEIPAHRRFPSDEMIYDFSPMDSGLRGYVWLFPVEGGRLNVGVMHTPGARQGAVAHLTGSGFLDRVWKVDHAARSILGNEKLHRSKIREARWQARSRGRVALKSRSVRRHADDPKPQGPRRMAATTETRLKIERREARWITRSRPEGVRCPFQMEPNHGRRADRRFRLSTRRR